MTIEETDYSMIADVLMKELPLENMTDLEVRELIDSLSPFTIGEIYKNGNIVHRGSGKTALLDDVCSNFLGAIDHIDWCMTNPRKKHISREEIDGYMCKLRKRFE